MGLNRYKAWVTLPAAGGGVIRPGEEFVADENDGRVKNGRAKLLGPAKATREPSPVVAEALAAIDSSSTAEPSDGSSDDAVDAVDEQPVDPVEAKPKRASRRKAE